MLQLMVVFVVAAGLMRAWRGEKMGNARMKSCNFRNCKARMLRACNVELAFFEFLST